MSKARKPDELNALGTVAGVMLSIIETLKTMVRDLGGTFADVYRLATPEGADDLRAIAAIIVRGAKAAAADTLRAMCVYTAPSYKELKSAFDWVNDWYERAEFKAIDICQSISREPSVVEFIYVHMDRSASTDEVLAEMEKRNLRPALYEEGVDFSQIHPDEQRKFPIVMLGSVCVDPSGRRGVACLFEDSVGRYLRLYRVEGDWDSLYRFLAVSK